MVRFIESFGSATAITVHDNLKANLKRTTTMTSEPYDFNFCFPIRDLESDRLKLTPFIVSTSVCQGGDNQRTQPSKHAEGFIALEPPSYQYLPFGPFNSVEDFMANLYDVRIHPNRGQTLFAVYDKTQVSGETGPGGSPDGALAGVMGYTNTSEAHLTTEIGFVLTFPRFQRTHVTSHAIGLLLHYALDLPSAGGLGLRRVEWRASPLNQASIRAAERMGFKRDGYFRWNWVLPEGKDMGNGLQRRDGDPRMRNVGRDSVIMGICWDDWEDSVKAQVDAVMARTS